MSEQRTEEWYKARLGKVTASRVADVTAKTKTGWGASRANYMAQLIVERLTGVHTETFTNAAMQWGVDNEEMARNNYSFIHDISVSECGFIPHNELASGCSPDGLVSEDGLLEIKCPNTATHLDFLLDGAVEGKYIKQMQWQMACSDRKWCDFISFDPRMPINLQMKVVRVERDDEMIRYLTSDIRDFLREVDQKITQLGAL